jgi:signal transduction histidine kinase
MPARRESDGEPAGADAAQQQRITELEAANRDLLARLDAAERRHRDNGYRFEAASSERQRAEQELERSRIRLRALASELTLAEARERRRLASALHDEVGQGLALSRIKLGLLGHLLTTDDARAVFAELRDLFARMSQRIRTLTFELSPPVLYQLGLAAAVEWLAEKLEKEQTVRCRVECYSSLERVDETVSILMFQSVRELLANVAKHAQAKEVVITLTFGAGWVTLAVQDDGVGFDPHTVTALSHKQDSFGLFSIGERMRYVNGTIEIDSAPGRGTRVTLSAPTTAAAR